MGSELNDPVYIDNYQKIPTLYYDESISRDYISENLDKYFVYTYGSTNDSNNNEIKEQKEQKEQIENIEKKEKEIKKIKAGRKRKREIEIDDENIKIHSKHNYDNIIRKIQVHFIKFIFSFINEILKNEGIRKIFYDIDYNIKKDIKNKNVEILKTTEIGQILSQNISTKNRKKYKVDKEINNKLYLEVIKNESIRKILSETYINIFRNIYYKNKRDLNDYGLNIKLSNNVKTYKDLLEKNIKDKKYIKEINNTVERCYLPKKIFELN